MLRPRPRTRPRGLRLSVPAALAALLLPLAALVPSGPAAAAAAPAPPPAVDFANPLVEENAPDPTILRAQDGYYYLYSTSTYLRGDPDPHTIPIYRSTDMVDWDHVGDVFEGAPEWITTPTGTWAPDVHYFNDTYYLYYSTSQTKALPRYGSPEGAYAIGVATSPTPTGPWTDAGPSAGEGFDTGPIVPPQWGWCTNPADKGCYDWVIDSHVYQGPDGVRYLYEGSYFGGNRLHQLAADGLGLVPGSAVQFGHQIRYEGAFLYPHLVGRERMYYMLASASNCCEGANTPYSVVANRGNQPYGTLRGDGSRGSFADHNGLPMEYAYGPPFQHQEGQPPFGAPIWWNLAGEGGGFPVLKANGNGIVGPGHQAVLADLTGQDWMYYHGVEESDPWADAEGGTEGGLSRGLYLDRLDWTADGWPVVNGGAGPTRGGPAPVAVPELGANFNRPSSSVQAHGAPEYSSEVRTNFRDSSGKWKQQRRDAVSSGHLRQTEDDSSAVTTSRQAVEYDSGGLRAECDLRSTGAAGGSLGCGLELRVDRKPGTGSSVTAMVDTEARTLVLRRTGADGVAGVPVSKALPAALDLRQWNHLVLELQPTATGTTVLATLQNSDRNPLVDLFLDVPDRASGGEVAVRLLTGGGTADFDNVSLTPRQPRTAVVDAPPAVGPASPEMSDDFGGSLGSQWSWLRENPALHGFAPSGALRLTTNGNLHPYQRINANRADPPALPLTENVLLQDAPAGDFMVETQLHFDPHTDGLSAGVALYNDDDNHVSNATSWNGVLTQVVSVRSNLTSLPPGASCPLDGPVEGANVAATSYSSTACPARSEHNSQEYPAATRCCWDGNGRADDPSRITVGLRLYRQGDVVTPWLSVDGGASWMRETAWTLPVSGGGFPTKIALYASSGHKANDPGAGAQAWFDYVHVHEMP